MKKYLSYILILSLAVSLLGCSFGHSGAVEPVTFYYTRNMQDPESFISNSQEGFFASEVREAAGHTGDLYYLLSLYLQGPLDHNLRSPFPTGCRVLTVYQKDGAVHVQLDQVFSSLENLELTVASACIAQTCIDLTDAEAVYITAKSTENTPVDIVIHRDSLLLTDELPEETVPQE